MEYSGVGNDLRNCEVVLGSWEKEGGGGIGDC